LESTRLHKVSIIVVTCNSLPALDDSLNSLRRVLEAVSYELIVVDNNSSDGSVECAREHFPSVRVIEIGRNIGFAAACNQGAWIASGDFLLFHNPDVCVDAGAVERLLEVCRTEEKAGAVAGRMRFPDGRFQATCRNLPTIGNLVFSRGSVLSYFYRKAVRYTLPDYQTITEVPAVAGTLMVIQRDVFTSLDGFDERFFMYMEDTDLSLRLTRAGYRNLFVPDAGGVHAWGKGSQAGRLKRRWYHHLSVGKYFLKHFPKSASLVILPVALAVNLVLALMVPEPSEKG
jgi:GT2 family glycosyltransferase